MAKNMPDDKKIELKSVQRNWRGSTYCGPALLTVLSGKDYNEMASLAEKVIDRPTNHAAKWMKFSDLHDCVLKLGYSVEAEYLDVDAADDQNPPPTLGEWLFNRDFLGAEMGDDTVNDTWLLNLTGHFVMVQGDNFLDNHTNEPVALRDAPFLHKQVRNAMKVLSPPPEQDFDRDDDIGPRM